ncbi:MULTISPECIES: hypothetical protein [Kitasatospora]|uniref:Uncharacterized protein n=1 Tax=Kitasatospora setae (strain ATCC 33774 / DSM 43861 / JCM 3304 / KCC A-0304 / NBRC 14216 / KM-6054) TaxID=452652 RepID=E4N695_KITSK|nr:MULTISPECIES: hypothetical protein [Kitasatospora]BAJ26726.1 hypothetical protein KSE_08890 [Kitasatospora setae KM-6054]
MICPHCRNNRRQRERTNHICSHCRKVFALDPKTDPGRLHDIKFRELVARSAPAGLRITVEQLFWANARRLHRFPTGRERRGSVTAGTVLAVITVVLAAPAVGVGGLALPLLGLPALLFGLLSGRQFRGAGRERPPEPFRYWLALDTFEERVVGRWRQVYGSLPDGLVEAPSAAHFVRPADPRAVVLCELPSVTAFLRINEFAARHRVLVARTVSEVPAELPVIVVRDLSLAALARTTELRARFAGRRVVDCGLLPRHVQVPARIVRLRAHDARTQRAPAVLADSPGWRRLPAQEREWLLDGWSSPLVSLPPVKLMSLLDKAVERAVTAPPVRPAPPAAPAHAPESAAETRRRAERIGFLTWPQAVPAPRSGSGAPAPAPAPASKLLKSEPDPKEGGR